MYDEIVIKKIINNCIKMKKHSFFIRTKFYIPWTHWYLINANNCGFFQVSLNHKFSTPEFEQKGNELKYNHGYKCLRALHYLSSTKLNKSKNPQYLVLGIWLNIQNSLLEIFSALKNPHYSIYNSSQRSYSTYS